MPTQRAILELSLVLLTIGVVGFGLSILVDARSRTRLGRRIDGVRGGPGEGTAQRQSVEDITLRRGKGRGRGKDGIGWRERVDRLFGIDRALMVGPGVAGWRVALTAVAAATAAVWALVIFAGLPALPSLFAGAGVALAVARLRYRAARLRTRARLLDQFPDAMGLVVRAIRAGIPVAESIRALGDSLPAPTGPEFRRVADEIAVGAELDVALKRVAERCGLPEYRFFVVAVVLQRETGGDLSETLELLAEVVRKRRAVRQRGVALSAEARGSAYVLAALPFVAGVGLYLLNPHYVLRLFTTPEGKAMLVGAFVLLMAGLLSMQAMIRKALA